MTPSINMILAVFTLVGESSMLARGEEEQQQWQHACKH